MIENPLGELHKDDLPTTRCLLCGTRNSMTLIRCQKCLALNDGKPKVDGKGQIYAGLIR